MQNKYLYIESVRVFVSNKLGARVYQETNPSVHEIINWISEWDENKEVDTDEEYGYYMEIDGEDYFIVATNLDEAANKAATICKNNYSFKTHKSINLIK